MTESRQPVLSDNLIPIPIAHNVLCALDDVGNACGRPRRAQERGRPSREVA